MNFIVLDNVTGCPLYGIVLLKEIKRTHKDAKIFRIPAEAWIAFLQVRYRHIPEVKAYLETVQNNQGINPQAGALLEAIDQRIDIPLEEFEYGMSLCGLEENNEGEEWKQI